jgi:hypothetical protein
MFRAVLRSHSIYRGYAETRNVDRDLRRSVHVNTRTHWTDTHDLEVVKITTRGSTRTDDKTPPRCVFYWSHKNQKSIQYQALL